MPTESRSRALAYRLTDFAAVLFDLDGVLTPTAEVHEAAWRETFNTFLAKHATGRAARPFEHVDYRLYVDGMPRTTGVRTFLKSRGLSLPEGGPTDLPGKLTVYGLGNTKDALFKQHLAAGEVEAFPGAERLVRTLRALGTRTAVVSSSHNAIPVLESAGIDDLFDAIVDGNVADRVGLVGKPAPDAFLAAARLLGLPASRCVVIEDAVAGVQAGRAGAFGLVIGVDRLGDGKRLLEQGADVVVRGMTELLPDARAEA